MNSLLKFAEEVTRHLGDGWFVLGSTLCASQVAIQEADGEVVLGLNNYDWPRSDRVVVTGRYPKYRSRPVVNLRNAPRITVAIRRGSEAVAKDIERRFLPDHQELVKEASARVARYEMENERARRVAQSLADVIGGEATVTGSRYDLTETFEIRFRRSRGLYFSAKLYGDCFNIDLLDIPVDLALEIGELLSSHIGKEAADVSV